MVKAGRWSLSWSSSSDWCLVTSGHFNDHNSWTSTNLKQSSRVNIHWSVAERLVDSLRVAISGQLDNRLVGRTHSHSGQSAYTCMCMCVPHARTYTCTQYNSGVSFAQGNFYSASVFIYQSTSQKISFSLNANPATDPDGIFLNNHVRSNWK